jgi:hypothetical protein
MVFQSYRVNREFLNNHIDNRFEYYMRLTFERWRWFIIKMSIKVGKGISTSMITLYGKTKSNHVAKSKRFFFSLDFTP